MVARHSCVLYSSLFVELSTAQYIEKTTYKERSIWAEDSNRYHWHVCHGLGQPGLPEVLPKPCLGLSQYQTRALLSQGEPRDAAVNFYMYGILQRHHAVSLPIGLHQRPFKCWNYTQYADCHDFSHNYLWKSTPLSLKCSHQTRVCREIATQGHSRSFILQSITGLFIAI